MHLLLVLAGIGIVLVASFLASVALTRAAGTGRPVKTTLADALSGRLKPGVEFETVATVQTVKFDGLQTAPALLLADGEARIQALAPREILERQGLAATILLPSHPNRMVGTVSMLGTYRIIGRLEELPIPHVKIFAMMEAKPS